MCHVVKLVSIVRYIARGCRTLLQATVLLVAVLCMCEVGVRVTEWDGGDDLSLRGDGEWLVASGTTRQRLQPLSDWTPSTEDAVPLRTNSLGLRGPEPAVPKPAETFRVVCLGDERVLAAGVHRQQTFCFQLQQLLQSRTSMTVEVLNAGVPGYCPLLSLLQVRHDLLPLEADLWVLTFDMGDVADDYRLRPELIVDSGGQPIACPHPVLRTDRLNDWQQLCRRFRLADLASRQLGRWWTRSLVEPPSEDPGSLQGQYAWLSREPPDWSVHIQQSLEPIDRLARLFPGRLVVAACPAPWQFDDKPLIRSDVRRGPGVSSKEAFDNERPFQVLREFTSRRGLPLCETFAAFRAAAREHELFQAERPELSSAGHLLFARLLATRLTGDAAVGTGKRGKDTSPVSHESPVRMAP